MRKFFSKKNDKNDDQKSPPSNNPSNQKNTNSPPEKTLSLTQITAHTIITLHKPNSSEETIKLFDQKFDNVKNKQQLGPAYKILLEVLEAEKEKQTAIKNDFLYNFCQSNDAKKYVFACLQLIAELNEKEKSIEVERITTDQFIFQLCEKINLLEEAGSLQSICLDILDSVIMGGRKIIDQEVLKKFKNTKETDENSLAFKLEFLVIWVSKQTDITILEKIKISELQTLYLYKEKISIIDLINTLNLEKDSIKDAIKLLTHCKSETLDFFKKIKCSLSDVLDIVKVIANQTLESEITTLILTEEHFKKIEEFINLDQEKLEKLCEKISFKDAYCLIASEEKPKDYLDKLYDLLIKNLSHPDSVKKLLGSECDIKKLHDLIETYSCLFTEIDPIIRSTQEDNNNNEENLNKLYELIATKKLDQKEIIGLLLDQKIDLGHLYNLIITHEVSFSDISIHANKKDRFDKLYDLIVTWKCPVNQIISLLKLGCDIEKLHILIIKQQNKLEKIVELTDNKKENFDALCNLLQDQNFKNKFFLSINNQVDLKKLDALLNTHKIDPTWLEEIIFKTVSHKKKKKKHKNEKFPVKFENEPENKYPKILQSNHEGNKKFITIEMLEKIYDLAESKKYPVAALQKLIATQNDLIALEKLVTIFGATIINTWLSDEHSNLILLQKSDGARSEKKIEPQTFINVIGHANNNLSKVTELLEKLDQTQFTQITSTEIFENLHTAIVKNKNDANIVFELQKKGFSLGNIAKTHKNELAKLIDLNEKAVKNADALLTQDIACTTIIALKNALEKSNKDIGDENVFSKIKTLLIEKNCDAMAIVKLLNLGCDLEKLHTLITDEKNSCDFKKLTEKVKELNDFEHLYDLIITKQCNANDVFTLLEKDCNLNKLHALITNTENPCDFPSLFKKAKNKNDFDKLHGSIVNEKFPAETLFSWLNAEFNLKQLHELVNKPSSDKHTKLIQYINNNKDNFEKIYYLIVTQNSPAKDVFAFLNADVTLECLHELCEKHDNDTATHFLGIIAKNYNVAMQDLSTSNILQGFNDLYSLSNNGIIDKAISLLNKGLSLANAACLNAEQLTTLEENTNLSLIDALMSNLKFNKFEKIEETLTVEHTLLIAKNFKRDQNFIAYETETSVDVKKDNKIDATKAVNLLNKEVKAEDIEKIANKCVYANEIADYITLDNIEQLLDIVQHKNKSDKDKDLVITALKNKKLCLLKYLLGENFLNQTDRTTLYRLAESLDNDNDNAKKLFDLLKDKKINLRYFGLFANDIEKLKNIITKLSEDKEININTDRKIILAIYSEIKEENKNLTQNVENLIEFIKNDSELYKEIENILNQLQTETQTRDSIITNLGTEKIRLNKTIIDKKLANKKAQHIDNLNDLAGDLTIPMNEIPKKWAYNKLDEDKNTYIANIYTSRIYTDTTPKSAIKTTEQLINLSSEKQNIKNLKLEIVRDLQKYILKNGEYNVTIFRNKANFFKALRDAVITAKDEDFTKEKIVDQAFNNWKFIEETEEVGKEGLNNGNGTHEEKVKSYMEKCRLFTFGKRTKTNTESAKLFNSTLEKIENAKIENN